MARPSRGSDDHGGSRPQKKWEMVVYHLQKISGKSGCKIKGPEDRLGRSSRNFPGATELLKRQSCFSGQNVPNGNSFSIYFKAIFDTSFTPSQRFFGKWNWFVQMVNSSPRRNSPFLNFVHHLPKPWTNLFAQYVKAKQPESWSSTFVLNTLRHGSDAVLFMSRT